MTVTFHEVSLDRIMELNGSIDFPKGKTVVLYGSNQQGKTNIINAIRYALLREVKGAGRLRTEYDDWALPSRKELVFNGEATIKILFDHNGVLFVLQRKISEDARREETVLYRLKKPSQKLEVEDFLKNRLKVSLLDALFAPEIVGGFKRLYSGEIDQSIAEMFKDITTIKATVMKFIGRIQKMKIAAQAEVAAIQRSYGDFCQRLIQASPQIEALPELTALQKFEVGKTTQKISDLHSKLQTTVTKLKEEALLNDMQDFEIKAEELDGLKKETQRHLVIKQSFQSLRAARSDYRKLRRWLAIAGRVTKITDKLPRPPPIVDLKIKENALDSFGKVARAKSLHKEMSRLAARNKIRPESVREKISELLSVMRILGMKAKIGRVMEGGVTEVARKAYAVLPVKLLAKRPSLGVISNEPIPRGSPEEKKQYQALLQRKIGTLRKIKDFRNEAESEFGSFLEHDIPELSRLANTLETRLEAIEKKTQSWSANVASASSSFLGKKVRVRNLRSERDVDSLMGYLTGLISTREKRYLKRLNENLKELDIELDELSVEAVRRASKKIQQQKKELPGLENVVDTLERSKPEWQKQEEVYSDYSQIPSMADTMTSVLQRVAEKCFDEGKLKRLIARTYNEIMKTMAERKLVKATVEVSEDTLRGSVKYRDKPITHPAGSEKAFFTLAILTALAHYFQTPVLIDEVANNLDTKNLKAFFDLVREFKTRWNVQYVLSVKETNDFDLDGWVKEIRDDIKVYEIAEKTIQERL